MKELSTLIIEKIKKSYTLEYINSFKIDFKNFYLLNKGDSFKKNSQWEVKIDSENSFYLISTNNSYSFYTINMEKNRTKNVNTAKYFYCYYELNLDFPDTIVKPKFLADYIINLFKFNNPKIVNNIKFNKKYIIETKNKNEVNHVFSEEILELISSKSYFYLEIRNNKCLLFSDSSIDYDETIIMIEVMKKVINNLKLYLYHK